MLKTVQEDIFNTAKTGAQVIIHQANCQCTMGSGIAKDIKARFPEAYVADCLTAEGDSSKLGRASTSAIATASQPKYPNLRFIVNLYGQDKYGLDVRHTNYEALAVGFERIRDWAKKNGFTVLSVPHRLGCNRAGGDWRVVYAILESVFAEDTDVTMLICENPALGQAVANKVSR
jgi:O-acetyl-ADP-ribose deacetylase (regulator of RNase III)